MKVHGIYIVNNNYSVKVHVVNGETVQYYTDDRDDWKSAEIKSLVDMEKAEDNEPYLVEGFFAEDIFIPLNEVMRVEDDDYMD